MMNLQTPEDPDRLTEPDENPAGEQTLSPEQAWGCVELVALDPGAIDTMREDMGDDGHQVVPYIVHALCVEVARQHTELETFSNATRVLGAMVNGLMGQEMADDIDELLTKLHAAGQRERTGFLAPDERFAGLVVDIAGALVSAAERVTGGGR
jgi:hypothetical protein